MEESYMIASQIQYNNEKEAEAIKDYSDFLKNIEASSLDEGDKEIIVEVISEIIADELNHQEKLQQLFTAMTKIEPNKD